MKKYSRLRIYTIIACCFFSKLSNAQFDLTPHTAGFSGNYFGQTDPA